MNEKNRLRIEEIGKKRQFRKKKTFALVCLRGFHLESLCLFHLLIGWIAIKWWCLS